MDVDDAVEWLTEGLRSVEDMEAIDVIRQASEDKGYRAGLLKAARMASARAAAVRRMAGLSWIDTQVERADRQEICAFKVLAADLRKQAKEDRG